MEQRSTEGGFHGFQPTIPSTIGEEASYNVFMRAKQLMHAVGASTPADSMLALRGLKDSFKGSGKVDDPEFLSLLGQKKLAGRC